MNTDIRIDWQSGMEITPQTFIDMENNIAENRMLVRKMIAAKNFGIIPRTKFSISQEVVNDKLILRQVDCDVMLPTGQVAVIETNVSQTILIPMKEVQELYLTVEVGEALMSFKKDGVSHVSNEYKFDLKPLEEIRSAMPILKLKQTGGAWTVYEPYIMPVMSVRTSVVLLEKLDLLKKSVQKIVSHDNVELMDDRVLVMLLVDQLAGFSVDDSSRELAVLCKKIVSALSYSVLGRKADLPAPNIFDLEPFLNVFLDFIDEVAKAMDELKPKTVVVKEPEPEQPVEDVWCPII